MIHIGNKEHYNGIKDELFGKPFLGKEGFIYLYCKFYEIKVKIVNSTIIWTTTDKNMKNCMTKNLSDKIRYGHRIFPWNHHA